MNSVLQGEERGGRARRLTVFENGTLLVPAVGMGEEGEYTCYAENQGGHDTMKVRKTFPSVENTCKNWHTHIKNMCRMLKSNDLVSLLNFNPSR